MQRIDILRGAIAPWQEIEVRRSLPQPFSVRHVAAGLGRFLGKHRAGKAADLAQEAIRQWHEAGRIEQAGTLDSIPAWRVA